MIDFDYRSARDEHDDAASRVTQVKDGGTALARYHYNGVGNVVGAELPEPNVSNVRFTTSGNYHDLDGFNRVTTDDWVKNNGTPLAFVDLRLAYDRNSNIEVTEDMIFTPAISAGFDVDYVMDNLNRLTKAEEGDWTPGSPGSITTRARQQIWTLDQVGNWAINRVGRNGDADFIDAGDLDESRTHNDPNELIDRDLDTDGDTAYDDTHYDLSYNKLGQLTDDGQSYEYEYDGFGRLRKIKNTSTQALVEEYTYNGLGHRIGWKYDTDVDGDTDGSDLTYYFAYDERWRIVGTFRSSDTSAKESFVYHNAGADGYGGSSYIDTVIMRDKDANTAWTSAADGTLERRDFYCHNWRGDVVALLTSDGKMNEWVKYSAYGVPYLITRSDTNGDGSVNSTDSTNVNNWWGTGVTKPTGDFDLNGNINVDDFLSVTNNWGANGGWGRLSNAALSMGNRKGYAGYEFDSVAAAGLWIARHRVLNSQLGRWTSRDPLEFVDGINMYEYVASIPTIAVDYLERLSE